MKTTIAIITVIAVAGLIGIACAERPTPGTGTQGTQVRNSNPVLSPTAPSSRPAGAGTQGTQSQGIAGSISPRAYDAHISSARIKIGGGISPTAHLLVTTPCKSLISPPSISDFCPWVDVSMKGWNRKCEAAGSDDSVEVST